VALANDDFDFHIQCFLVGAQFFDQTAEAPKSYSKALKCPESAKWVDAVQAELAAMDILGAGKSWMCWLELNF
jgi:hypothetical protein